MHGKNEWSGELITSESGTINDLDKWVITAEEMFLADVGSPGFTSYEVDKGGFKSIDIVEMYEKFPDIENGTKKNHHIHTHHSMSSFFSSTDWENLHDRALVSNYFLMLIVNIEGNYVAKVGFRAKQESGKDTILEFSNNADGLSPLRLVEKPSKEMLVVMDCKIDYCKFAMPEDDFCKRYQSVVKAVKEEEEKKRAKIWADERELKHTGFGMFDPRDFATDKKSETSQWVRDPMTGEWSKQSITKKKPVETDTNTFDDVWQKKEEKKIKKISEMTQKEWEEYSKEPDPSSKKWTNQNAVGMLLYIIGNSYDTSKNECRSLLNVTEFRIKNERQRDAFLDNFESELPEAFQILFPEEMDNSERYYELLAMMRKYLDTVTDIPLARDLSGVVEEEMIDVADEIINTFNTKTGSII